MAARSQVRRGTRACAVFGMLAAAWAGAGCPDYSQVGPGTSSSSGTGAGGGAGTGGGDRAWASWPMPNPAEAGLPNPASYDGSDPYVVVDQVTGLVWQKDPPGMTQTWSQANDYCALQNAQSLGGFSTGWRLPTRIELVSLVDFTRQAPALDPAVTGPAANTWSSSAVSGNAAQAWMVNFFNGITGARDKSLDGFVRCVH